MKLISTASTFSGDMRNRMDPADTRSISQHNPQQKINKLELYLQ